MKWLLILFLGIIVIPTFAQNATINQTGYQKLTNSINGIQIASENIGSSINKTRNEIQNDYQNLGGNINETRVEAKNYFLSSLWSSGAFTIIAFLGGVAIAAIIYLRQRREQGEIRNLISRVDQISSRQEEVAQEVREDISSGLIGNLEVVIITLMNCIDLFELRDQETDLTRREHFMRSMISEYDGCYGILNLEINLIELMKIFGRATARQYWALLSHLGIHSSIYVQSEDDLQSFILHVNECLGRCLLLNDMILS